MTCKQTETRKLHLIELKLNVLFILSILITIIKNSVYLSIRLLRCETPAPISIGFDLELI